MPFKHAIGLDAQIAQTMFDVDDAGGSSAAGTPTPNAQPPAAPAASWLDALPEEAKKEILELRKEAAERRVENKRLKEADEKRLAEAKAAEEKRLADQQEWQKLADARAAELAAVAPKAELADRLLARIDAANKAKIEKLPSDMQSLVPTAYDVIALSEWLDANYERLASPKPVNLDGGRRGDGTNTPAVNKPVVRF